MSEAIEWPLVCTGRGSCECEQCAADDDEDTAIYVWEQAKSDELWRRYRNRPRLW